MPEIPEFFALNEITKPREKRVYHNNSGCPAGKGIRVKERRAGTCGYRICEDCKERNEQESSVSSLATTFGNAGTKASFDTPPLWLKEARCD